MTQLKYQARKRGYNPTKADLQAVVGTLGTKQIFQDLQPSRGRTAVEEIARRFMADLADVRLNPNSDDQYF